MPSSRKEALCLRCETPLTRPAEERAIDEALGLGADKASEDSPLLTTASDDFFINSSYDEDELETAEEELGKFPSEAAEWELDLSSSETRRLLGQSWSEDPVFDTTEANEPFSSLLHLAATAPAIGKLLPEAKPPQTTKPRGIGSTLKSFAAWTAICLGLMAFACGGVLLGLSVLGERGELWSLGVPITLVGQVALLVGLCLQLDRLWSENRDTAQRIGEMDEQLDELRQSTRLLGTPYHSASQSFYAHLSEGASPKMLLSDLKGQIDLLALRMSQEENRR